MKLKKIMGLLLSVIMIFVMSFSTEGVISVSAAENTGTQSANEAYIYSFLRNELGFNNAAAVGVLANIFCESSFYPTASCIDTNGKESFGICQWNASRNWALRNYCSSHGYSVTSLEAQLRFLRYELNSSENMAYTNTGNVPDTAYGAYMAAYNFAMYFERCNSVYFEQRAVLARDTYWPKYSGGKDDDSGSVSVEANYPTGTYVVDANALNIRKGPGTAYGIVGNYYKGDKVKVTSVSGNWGKTDKGWIAIWYCSLVPTTVSHVGFTGKCGENIYWKFDKTTGTLILRGTGSMYQYSDVRNTPWFAVRNSIKSVSVDNYITSIGSNAFYGCPSLTRVWGMGRVTSIGTSAFRNCPKLARIDGCYNLANIGKGAFYGCKLLRTIGNTYGIVNIPSVKAIGESAFSECSDIRKVSTGAALTFIGQAAFKNATHLSSVTGLSNITRINDYAFYGDVSLITISGCSKVTSIGSYAFYNCHSFVKAGGVDGKVMFPAVKKIEQHAFFYCTSMKYFQSGNKVTSISAYAFYATSQLKNLYMSNSRITFAGKDCFDCINNNAVITASAGCLSVLRNKGQGSTVRLIGR